MAEGTQIAVQMEELNKNLKLLSSALVDLTAKLNEIQDTQTASRPEEKHLTSGYVNWSTAHDILKTEKWVKMSAFLKYCQKPVQEICTDLRDINEDDKYVIDEKTRFPQDELYVNLNNPLVRAKVLYIQTEQAYEVDRNFNIAKGAHTFSSFEKEHGLKWVEPISEATNAVTECIQKSTSINKTPDETFEPATRELWTLEELDYDEPEATNTMNDDLHTQKSCKNIANILDKLTRDNFQSKWKTIEKQILEVNNEKRLQLVGELLYEKVLEKPESSEVFAILVSKLAKLKVLFVDDPDKVKRAKNFRGYIINKCQEHFDKIVGGKNDNDLIFTEVENNIHDKKMVNRMQAVANSKFIGELYKVGMLTRKIVDYCLRKLSDSTDDDKLECFCELLATVGKELDDSGVLDYKFVQKLHNIINYKKNEISERVLLIIQDVIDLEKKGWVVSAPVIAKNLPKTIDEIQSETHKRTLLRELMNDFGLSAIEQKEQTKVSSDGDRRSKLTGRIQVLMFPQSIEYSVETLKLESSSQKTLNYIQDPPECFLGLDSDILDKLQADPASREDMLESDVASERRASMKFLVSPLESDEEKKINLKSKIRAIIDQHLLSDDIGDLVSEVEQLMPKDHVAIVNEILDFVLEKSIVDIRIVARSLLHLVVTNTIKPNDFLAALKATLHIAPVMLTDIPYLYRNLGILIAPIVAGSYITFNQIFEVSERVISEDQGQDLLFSLIENMYDTSGFYITKKLWQKSEMRASQWTTEELSLELCPEIILNIIGDN